MGQSPGLVLGQRLQPVAPNPLAITNISILVVPNTPTTRMLILLILIILPATPFPLSSPSIPHRSYSCHAIPLNPSIPHHSYSRTPFPLSQHSTPLLFPHAIPLIPAFHTAPIPARHSLIPQHSTPLLFPHHSPYPPAFHTTSCSRTPFPLTPAFHTAPIPARHSLIPSISTQLLFPHAIPLIPQHSTPPPVPARQTPLTTRSRHLSKHPHIPCLTAIPYLFAMASMASVKESRLLFIDFLLSLCLER